MPARRRMRRNSAADRTRTAARRDVRHFGDRYQNYRFAGVRAGSISVSVPETRKLQKKQPRSGSGIDNRAEQSYAEQNKLT